MKKKQSRGVRQAGRVEKGGEQGDEASRNLEKELMLKKKRKKKKKRIDAERPS